MPNISFDEFRELATRPGLQTHQRTDDPTDIRAGKHDRIFADIVGKLPVLAGRDRSIVEIGPGCGPLAFALIDLCADRGHHLCLVDSAEMLAHLPDPPFVTKVAGQFPGVFGEVSSSIGRTDAVLAYGILHYVFEHDNIWAFLDRALALLAPGGCLLLGDVPNWSRRKRMLSAQGQSFAWFEPRAVEIWPGGLTDSVLFGFMGRAAESGFDSYLLPQPADLPMAGWRVDLLFRRPA